MTVRRLVPVVALPVMAVACSGGTTSTSTPNPATTAPDDVTATPPSPPPPAATAPTSSARSADLPPAPREPLTFLDALQPDDGQWHAPYGVDVASDGTTWVFDTENNALLAFNPDGTNVVYRKSEGSGDGQFDSLGFGSLAVGPDDEIYVVDNGNAGIQVFDPEGNFLRAWGETGDGEGQFQRAIGIAVDDNGQVYVTDDERPEVQVFDSEGTFLRAFGEPGDGPGGLVHATGIDVDADGHAWVADYEEKRTQVFDPAGAVVAEHRIPGPIGTTGTPEGIVVLDDGRVWVTSYRGGEVVQVPVSSGSPRQPSASPSGDPEPWPVMAGGEGTGAGTFGAPVDLAVGPDGTFVVTDQQANTVQRFRPAG